MVTAERAEVHSDHRAAWAIYPLTGDQVHDHVAAAARDFLRGTRASVGECYRLDILGRQAARLSAASGPTASA